METTPKTKEDIQAKINQLKEEGIADEQAFTKAVGNLTKEEKAIQDEIVNTIHKLNIEKHNEKVGKGTDAKEAHEEIAENLGIPAELPGLAEEQAALGKKKEQKEAFLALVQEYKELKASYEAKMVRIVELDKIIEENKNNPAPEEKRGGGLVNPDVNTEELSDKKLEKVEKELEEEIEKKKNETVSKTEKEESLDVSATSPATQDMIELLGAENVENSMNVVEALEALKNIDREIENKKQELDRIKNYLDKKNEEVDAENAKTKQEIDKELAKQNTLYNQIKDLDKYEDKEPKPKKSWLKKVFSSKEKVVNNDDANKKVDTLQQEIDQIQNKIDSYYEKMSTNNKIIIDKNEEWRKIYNEVNILETSKITPHSILYPNAYKAFEKINPKNTYFQVDLLNKIKDADGNYQDPIKHHGRTFNFFNKINPKEGYFDFSLLGFYKILKNPEKVTTKDGIVSNSPEAIYRVIGPDGKNIVDNVGSEEASRVMYEESEKYRAKLEKEFIGEK